MKKQLFITTIILGTLIAAVARPASTVASSPEHDGTIRASGFSYDASMPVVHSKSFIYDPTAPVLHGAGFRD